MPPLVSIVIPTKNSTHTLKKCLVSIQNQTYTDIEIIVVDNYSTDGTYEIAGKYISKVFQKWPERTTQKNYGIENAEWEYICFIDSDMELTDRVIESCVRLSQDTVNTWGICIPEDSVWEWLFVLIRAFERSFYQDTRIESARFFRLADVRAVGGFEEDLIFFEESLLPQKIESILHKSTHHRVDDLIHHHEDSISLWSWLSKKYYYGKSLDAYLRKVKEIGITTTADVQIGIMQRYMIFLSDSRFYTRPILALWVLVLKTMEFWAGAMGLVYSKLKK